MRSLIGCLFLFLPLSIYANPWEAFSSPTSGPEQSVGSYSNGCLFGGRALPLRGQGYQVIRPSRLRYFAHPYMVDFLEGLARETQRKGVPDLLVADLSMPRGGQFSSGHKSHQTGLDADIWLSFSQQKLESEDVENIKATSLVNLREYTLNEAIGSLTIYLDKNCGVRFAH
ncbi:penicillin-insensitive murein endopeptidase [Veronia nyctiphanis]|uniref:penicillin-insensitive murein endopeptidase n=1 Tax=Veronia nyctiphanis TaxID=1278244 RepID=UPI002E25D073